MTNGKKNTMVIFDFDGVIADSYWLAYKTAKKEHPGLTEEIHRSGFEGNIYEVEKKWAHMERVRIDYFAEYEKETHLVEFFEVHELIPELANMHLLSIVSSSTTSLIEKFLEREGMRGYFSDILGADVHESKHEKIKMLFEKHGIAAPHAVMVTDTSGDVYEARMAGVESIGVSWGYHESERLERSKPLKIIHSPEELVPVIAEYFSR